MDSKIPHPSTERPLAVYDIVHLPPPLAGSRGVILEVGGFLGGAPMARVFCIRIQQTIWLYTSELKRCGKVTDKALSRYAPLVKN